MRPRFTGLTGLIARPDGFVLGSSNVGASTIRNGEARLLSVDDGLPCGDIFAMAQTQDYLWLYAECGVMKMRHTEWRRWWTDLSEVHTELLDIFDGAQPALSDECPIQKRVS